MVRRRSPVPACSPRPRRTRSPRRFFLSDLTETVHTSQTSRRWYPEQSVYTRAKVTAPSVRKLESLVQSPKPTEVVQCNPLLNITRERNRNRHDSPVMWRSQPGHVPLRYRWILKTILL
eukprot:PhF_6_TR4824/c4_g2_i1/m.6685